MHNINTMEELTCTDHLINTEMKLLPALDFGDRI